MHITECVTSMIVYVMKQTDPVHVQRLLGLKYVLHFSAAPVALAIAIAVATAVVPFGLAS